MENITQFAYFYFLQACHEGLLGILLLIPANHIFLNQLNYFEMNNSNFYYQLNKETITMFPIFSG